MTLNDLGVSAITRLLHDPDGTGVLSGRAVLVGPGDNQVQKGTDGVCAGVTRYNCSDGEDNAIQTANFAKVESAGAVAVGDAVYIADAEGRVGASGTAQVGIAVSATDGEGERLSVDLSTRGNAAAPTGG